MKNPRARRINPDTIVLIKQIFYGVLVIAAVALVVTGLWYGSRIQPLTITEVSVSGGETIDHGKVRAIALQALEGNYIGLIPHAFAWTYPKATIQDNLQQFERIHDIQIERTSGTALAISFAEYVPRALWCRNSDQSDCAFIDADGYAFAKSPNLAGGSLLRFVRTDEDYAIRQTLLPTDDFERLQNLVKLLADNDWFVSTIEVDTVGDAFLSVVGGGELKVTVAASPEEIVANLLAVLTSDEFAHLKAGNFQYIDLRFGSKVFVNEVLATPEADSGSASSTQVNI